MATLTHPYNPTQHLSFAGLKRWFRENGLSVSLFTLFIVFGGAQYLTGHAAYNEEQREHGQPTIGYVEYARSGHFLEALAENWESEFLQMGAYVFMTVMLFQKGSSESKPIGEKQPVDEDPRKARFDPKAPWPVRKGGLVLKLYEHSLSLAFLLLFLISFFLHALGGTRHHNEEQLEHGQPTVTMLQFMKTSEFWFQSFQNWQSEFLAIFAMVVLSIYLRERGSPESKPVAAPHRSTGEDAS